MPKITLNNNNDNNNNGGEPDQHDGACACCAANGSAAASGPAADRNHVADTESVHSIEMILRRDERNESIRLAGVRCEAGSRPGDNYMSVVKRVHAYGTADSGEVFRRTLIVKRPILRHSRRQLFRCDEAFANEIAAFCHLVPDLLDIASQNRATADDAAVLPFPRCLYAGSDAAGELIVMEDLRRSGYGMVDRLQGLDFAHARLVMQKLGALHGVSVAMRTLRPTRFQRMRRTVQEIVYCAEAADFYATSLNSSVREALASLRASNAASGELNDAILHVERMAGGRMYELMARAVCGGGGGGGGVGDADATEDGDTSDYDWNVMCHGDLWVNNLMFRYDEESDRVADVRLIDLQTARCASPAIDILHFVFTSTERSMRDAHLDELLQDYLDAVLTEVRRHVSEAGQLAELCKQYTLANVWRELRSKIAYGLGISMWLLPAVTFHPDRIPDLNTLTLSDLADAKQETVMIQMQSPEYHARIRDVVLEFGASGYFGCMDCV